MKYSKIRKLDVANGPGIRVSIFVSGCRHKCRGCFNEQQQDFDYGSYWTEEVEKEVLDLIANPIVVGLNILGGEPLQQTMDDCLLNFLRAVNDRFPDKDIWMWTGDLYEEAINDIKKRNLIEEVDVLIDGRFEIDKRNIKLKYRGSENQRIIDVKRSFSESRLVELAI